MTKAALLVKGRGQNPRRASSHTNGMRKSGTIVNGGRRWALVPLLHHFQTPDREAILKQKRVSFPALSTPPLTAWSSPHPTPFSPKGLVTLTNYSESTRITSPQSGLFPSSNCPTLAPFPPFCWLCTLHPPAHSSRLKSQRPQWACRSLRLLPKVLTIRKRPLVHN